MPEPQQWYYWDACVFLSYINRYPDRVSVLDKILVESARSDGKIQIVTSTISIVEVAWGIQEQTNKAPDPATEARIDSFWHGTGFIKPLEFHAAIGRLARGLMKQSIANGWKLRPLDAIHLATAQQHRVAEFYTYSKDLRKYASFLPFPIGEPHTLQGELEF